MTGDGSHAYAWDAENRPVTLDGVGLTYDALGRMVEQNRSGSYTEIVYAPTGAKLALMNGQSLVRGFVPLPGGATAVYTSTGLDHYRHSDWLGSARVTSSPSRAYVSGVAYAPFGETYATSGTPDLSFTGQNPDTSAGDYDFLYREYSNQGRWSSPDPAGLAAVDLSNPQSWNRYAYVFNNPTDLLDPLGLSSEPGALLDFCYLNGIRYDGAFCDLIYGNICRLLATTAFGLAICINRCPLGDCVKEPRHPPPPQQQTKMSPKIQSCLDAAGQWYKNQAKIFAISATGDLLWRTILYGAVGGGIKAWGRYGKTENLWVFGTATVIGAAVGATSSFYNSRKAIDKINAGYMAKVSQCVQENFTPPPTNESSQ